MGHLFLQPEQVHQTCVLVFLHQLLISGQGPHRFVGQLDSVRTAGLQAVVLSRRTAGKGGKKFTLGRPSSHLQARLVMESLKMKNKTRHNNNKTTFS